MTAGSTLTVQSGYACHQWTAVFAGTRGGGHTICGRLRTAGKTCIMLYRFAMSTTLKLKTLARKLSSANTQLTYIVPRNDLEHNPLSREEYKFLEKWAVQRGDAVGHLVNRLIGENKWHEKRFQRLNMIDLDLLYNFIRFLEEEEGIQWE